MLHETPPIESDPWAPAPQNAFRALNFDVDLTAVRSDRFTELEQERFVAAFNESFDDVEFGIMNVYREDQGIRVRVEVVMSKDSGGEWVAAARPIYGVLRNGTCADVLDTRVWGMSSVGQVTLPYLVFPDSDTSPFVQGKTVYGLMLSLQLHEHNMTWLTEAMAQQVLQPLQELGGLMVGNTWKHAYMRPPAADSVVLCVQLSSYSQPMLAAVGQRAQTAVQSLWPVEDWGRITFLPGIQVVTLGGELASAPSADPVQGKPDLVAQPGVGELPWPPVQALGPIAAPAPAPAPDA